MYSFVCCNKPLFFLRHKILLGLQISPQYLCHFFQSICYFFDFLLDLSTEALANICRLKIKFASFDMYYIKQSKRYGEWISHWGMSFKKRSSRIKNKLHKKRQIIQSQQKTNNVHGKRKLIWKKDAQHETAINCPL